MVNGTGTDPVSARYFVAHSAARGSNWGNGSAGPCTASACAGLRSLNSAGSQPPSESMIFLVYLAARRSRIKVAASP